MLKTEVNGKTPSYMELAKWKFLLTLPDHYKDSDLQRKLLAGICEGNMAPYYTAVCADLNWNVDHALLAKMQAANREKLLEFDKENDSGKSRDEEEPRLWQEKLEYLSSIGDKEAAMKLATEKSQDTSLSTNCRLDAVFAMFRIAYFHGCDRDGMKNAIDKAVGLIDGTGGAGGDWSARNKLKAYEAICSLGHRDYGRAANLLLDAVPTFESYELLDFGTLIRYTVLSCMIALSRCELNEKLKNNGAVMQSLHAQYPDLLNFYRSLDYGRYSEFFVNLAMIETSMRLDHLLHPHYRHYIREMRLKAYSQLLQAYRSLSLKSMAEAFGVTEEYVENEVAKFAASGRLQCKIDRVAGAVVTNSYVNDDKAGTQLPENAPEATYQRDIMYQNTIKHGDHLLNRLKKLTRIMDF
ncbi:26S proteasome non-ATPase regulatory subunit 6-like [Periplaneta americana]|uniref:26S proteasome non-ATPase regulatory subunit 6-like n=1 Tax=Periplaneta americana TaxID=6978 RepID=UPI0037E88159